MDVSFRFFLWLIVLFYSKNKWKMINILKSNITKAKGFKIKNPPEITDFGNQGGLYSINI